MEIKILENVEQIGKAAAKIYIDFTNANENPVLGFATGMTPVPTYNEMIAAYERGEVSFKNVTTFNLDEYCDLDKMNKNSFYMFMVDNLFAKTDFDISKVNFLDGNAEDFDEESKRYAEKIKESGGIDIQILGVGTNGHIAFNEPSDSFSDEAFRVALTQSTIDSNQKFFGDVPMPRFAMTMGIGSIMKSKKIIFIATGESKAKAVKAMIEGEVTPECPASILQQHPDVLVLLDKAAASLLNS